MGPSRPVPPARHTGDIATRDEDGHFSIVDRRKDMIITGGFNVYPAEIERVVAMHPAVAMVAVGPVADEVRGRTGAGVGGVAARRHRR